MTFHIDRITVAVNDMANMVHFYNTTFQTGLQLADPGSDFPFHIGRLGTLELFFCPNVITQIEAVKNRQQLRVVVEDLAATLHTGIGAGGAALGEVQQTPYALVAGLSDPDGNSIELIQYL